MTPRLSATGIREALETSRRFLHAGPETPLLGREIEIHDQTGSTNDRTDQLGSAGAPEGVAVFAEAQSAGRGRGGNRWSAPPGLNLTFSVLLRPSWPIEHWPRCAHAAGLAVARAVEPWLEGIPVQLKWPNDVYADGRKLAGLLLEMKGSRKQPHLIVGIGINVNSLPTEFPPDLHESLTSIRVLRGGTAVDRNHLAGTLLAELGTTYARCGADFPGLLDEIRTRSLLLGRAIRFSRQGRWEEGVVVDFGPEGEMLVLHPGTGLVEAISAAESVRLMERPS